MSSLLAPAFAMDARNVKIIPRGMSATSFGNAQDLALDYQMDFKWVDLLQNWYPLTNVVSSDVTIAFFVSDSKHIHDPQFLLDPTSAQASIL